MRVLAVSIRAMSRPTTIGALRAFGWKSRGVKDELRENLVARLGDKGRLFPGIVGFD